MIEQRKGSVLGVMVDVVDYETAVHQVTEAAIKHSPYSATALAVHGVMTGHDSPQHRYRLNSFDLVCPDGQPVRWALNWLYGSRLHDRVYGPELMLRICHRAAEEGLPIFLYGSSADVLERLTERLQARFPRLIIAGAAPSQFRTISRSERDELIQTIIYSGARLMFVGLGCPRQEIFAYEMTSRIGMPLVAVGAAFPFHAGLLQQAPHWMQRVGLEWLYRLWTEPRRLWRRYILLNPRFVSLLLSQVLGMKTYDTSGHPPDRELLYG